MSDVFTGFLSIKYTTLPASVFLYAFLPERLLDLPDLCCAVAIVVPLFIGIKSSQGYP